MHANHIQAIKDLIKKAQTQEAIDLLEQSVNSSWSDERKNQVMHVQAQLSRLKKEEVKGLYTREELAVKYNHLHEDILAFMAGKPLPSTTKTPPPTVRNKMKVWVLGLIGLVLIGLVFVLVPRFLTPATFAQQFIFYANEAKSERITSGEISFIYEGLTDSRTINEQGILLPALPQTLRGKEIMLQPNISGFTTEPLSISIPKESSPIQVIISPKKYHTVVKGNLSLANGNPAVGYRVEFGGQEDYSDPQGDFSVTLTVPLGTEVLYRIFKEGTLVKEDYQTVQDLLIKIGLP